MITFNSKGKEPDTHGNHYMHQKIVEKQNKKIQTVSP